MFWRSSPVRTVHRHLLHSLLILMLALTLTFPTLRAAESTPIGQPELTVVVPPGKRMIGEVGLTAIGEGYLSPVTSTARPFTHLMLRWEADLPGDTHLELAVRASLDGTAWTDWGMVSENHDLWMPEDGEHVFWSSEIYAGPGMRFWQVRVRPEASADGQLPTLQRIHLYHLDARFGPAIPIATPATTDPAALSRPPVVSRTAWGSPDGQGSRAEPDYYPVRHMVVHHTTGSNSLRSGEVWADRVRSIWSFHALTRGWGDIGYNYLIDPNGVIYEGRAGGDDAVGFHDTANYGSMGVALIGDYSSVAPQTAALNSLVDLFAWKAEQKDIDPLGRSFYYGCSRSRFCHPFNPGAVVDHISGHRHVTPRTACPGEQAVNLLPELRQRVMDRLGSPNPQPEAAIELSGVRYERLSLASGELLKVVFTIKNSGPVAIEGQTPEAVAVGSYTPGLELEQSHVYEEQECFIGSPTTSYRTFPKVRGRFRVMLGPVDAARQPPCAGDTGGYPWRWGIGGRLEPGATREIVGYVRLHTSGEITLKAGAIYEYMSYQARDVAPTTITVSAERQLPLPTAYDLSLNPLAHVYQLGPTTVDLLERTADPTAVVRGAYVGSFTWFGEERNWALGGPLPGLNDYFMVEQVRVFTAPVTGTYTFQLNSDDGAWLWINNQLLISYPGRHDAIPITATIELAAGHHLLGVKMFELTGAAIVGYSVRPPGSDSFISLQDGLIDTTDDHSGSHVRSLNGLTIAATDLGGSGIDQLRVMLNGAAWQTITSTMTTVKGFQSGLNTLSYIAVDKAGNLSEQRQIMVNIDPNLGVRRVYLPVVHGP